MKTILSIDDDPWVTETLQDALTLKGYRVLTATTAADGLQVLGAQLVDLILLDLGMPGKNGFVLYRELMATRRAAVLFVSGCSRSFAADSNEFVALWTNEFLEGTTDILYKPFNLELLYEKVEALIGDSSVTAHEPVG